MHGLRAESEVPGIMRYQRCRTASVSQTELFQRTEERLAYPRRHENGRGPIGFGTILPVFLKVSNPPGMIHNHPPWFAPLLRARFFDKSSGRNWRWAQPSTRARRKRAAS